jgi:hypothetical protein
METRMDLSFCVLDFWSQFPINHTDACKGIKRVIISAGNQDLRFRLERDPNSTLVGYIDAEFGNSRDGKPITREGFSVGKYLVSWMMKNQNLVVKFEAEAELAH